MTKPFILDPSNPARDTVKANLHRFIDALAPNLPWVISIKRHVKSRTNQQNAALFACAYPPIMEYAGLRGSREKEDLHEYYCGEFFGWIDRPILGRVPRRTTTTNEAGFAEIIDREEFWNFYTFIQTEAAKVGVYVEDPNPEYKLFR